MIRDDAFFVSTLNIDSKIMTHKAGFVNIVGNPNVGKSTLMNQLVGERISIATFKAQTTRHRIMGIVNTPELQIVYSDTPGVLRPNYKLQESMLEFSESALGDADVLLYVTDTVETADKNEFFLERVRGVKQGAEGAVADGLLVMAYGEAWPWDDVVVETRLAPRGVDLQLGLCIEVAEVVECGGEIRPTELCLLLIVEYGGAADTA